MAEIIFTVIILGTMFFIGFVGFVCYWNGHREGYYHGWKQAEVCRRYKKSVSEELIDEKTNN